MAFFKRRLSGSQQAAEAAANRGLIATGRGYVPSDWNDPARANDRSRRVRVVPVGPLSQEWPGVQRINEASKVGTRRAALYGAFPTSPYQSYRSHFSRVQQNNQAAFSQGAGMVTAQMQDQKTQDFYDWQYSEQPGFLESFLARVRGR